MANVPRLVNTKSSGNNQNQENRFVLMEELINGMSVNLHLFERRYARSLNYSSELIMIPFTLFAILIIEDNEEQIN